MAMSSVSPRSIHLRPAVLSDGRDLSRDARAEILARSGARPGRFALELAWAWTVVALAIGFAVWADHWAASLLAIFLVGTRQVVLALLLHEQVHRLGWRGRWGDTWVNLLCTYPLLATTVEDYSEVHLRHHKHFMSARDPDFLRKAGPDWAVPLAPRRALRMLVRDLTGLNTLALIRGKTAPQGIEFKRPRPTPRWVRPVYLLSVAAAVTALGIWPEFLLYWVLPILTVTQLGVRWIAVLEHEYNHEGASVAEVTPLVRMKPWQRWLLPDLNFALHVYHHQHPGVSFSQLPAVHAVYLREGRVDESAVFDGAGAYLRFVLSGVHQHQARSRQPLANARA
jgi:fatty acid desaturase